jgi:hypothetical protein
MDDYEGIEKARRLATIDTLLDELATHESGISFIYSALDLLAVRYRIRDAAVVLRNDSFGTQIFRMRGRAVSSNLVAALGSHPGVYCTSDIVPQSELDAVYLACQQSFSSQFVKFNTAHNTASYAETPTDSEILEPMTSSNFDDKLATASHHARVTRRSAQSSLSQTSRMLVSQFLIFVDVVVFIMTVADINGPLRFVFGLILGVVIPGWSIVGPLKLNNPPLEFGLTLSVGASLLMIVAQILMTTNLWHLAALEDVVCIVCLPSLIFQARSRRSSGQHTGPTEWVKRKTAPLSSLRLPDFIHRAFTDK